MRPLLDAVTKILLFCVSLPNKVVAKAVFSHTFLLYHRKTNLFRLSVY